MNALRPRRWLSGLFILALASTGFAQEWTVVPQKQTAVYSSGNNVGWDVKAPDLSWSGQIPYAIKANGGKVIASGQLEIQSGRGVLRHVATEPGALLAEFTVTNAQGKVEKMFGGAIVDPEKIRTDEPAPADFDSFWRSQIAELEKIPVNPVLTAAPSDRPGVTYHKITLDNIRGTKVQGQIARPEKGDKFPALLQVQWAGVYPLDKSWVTNRAAQGWLMMNIQAHDIPIDAPASYYDNLNKGELGHYVNIGNESRDTCYFLRMYLSCYRAAEYLTSRPDWDGKIFVVRGGSQGGMQTLVLAGLHPKVTAAIAEVPAGCDLLGVLHGRDSGWPKWWVAGGDKASAIFQTAHYFDTIHFAARVHAPTLVCVGAIDTTCPPAGVISAFNEISAPKELVIMPLSGHSNHNGSQNIGNQRVDAWLNALRGGNRAPAEK